MSPTWLRPWHWGPPPWGSAARTPTHWPSAARTASWPNCAELDLLMAIDGFPTLADLRAGGAQRI